MLFNLYPHPVKKVIVFNSANDPHLHELE